MRVKTRTYEAGDAPHKCVGKATLRSVVATGFLLDVGRNSPVLLIPRLIGNHHTSDGSICFSYDRLDSLFVVLHRRRLNDFILCLQHEMDTYSDDIGENDA